MNYDLLAANLVEDDSVEDKIVFSPSKVQEDQEEGRNLESRWWRWRAGGWG